MRANTALQIGLRPLGRAESIDIIGSHEAAFISKRTPGRAWSKLGEDALVPFQSGYVGAPPNVRWNVSGRPASDAADHSGS